MQGKIILLSGYKGTGKDELYKLVTSSSQKGWKVWKWSEITPITLKDHFLSGPIKRVSIADKIKEEANKIFMIPPNVPKDKPFIQGEMVTPRDLYVLVANTKPCEDWMNEILPQLKEHRGVSVITDFRHPEEYEFLKQCLPSHELITVRLYRQSVPEPSKKDMMERSLDSFPFDYLLTSINEEIVVDIPFEGVLLPGEF